MVVFVQMVRIALRVTVRKGLAAFTVRYGQTSARENPVATGYVSMTTHSIGATCVCNPGYGEGMYKSFNIHYYTIMFKGARLTLAHVSYIDYIFDLCVQMHVNP